MINLCPICSSNENTEIFHEDNVPLFQNKVYSSEKDAKHAEKGLINLFLCKHCGFVWNGSFDSKRLDYNSDYQNEQSHSPAFMEHLSSVKQIIEKKKSKSSHIIEIGCGKGTFLNLLQNSGYYNLSGFDPSYEGNFSYIQKCYYSQNNKHGQVDLFIMRHVLEHIPDPLNFLKNISSPTEKESMIYIEVPDFEWIVKNGAFWDISYEHCNYFSLSLFESILPSCETGYLFGDQYLYAIGDFKIHIPETNTKYRYDASKTPRFNEKMEYCKSFVSENSNLALWGAGAKGANFARMVDPNCQYIKCIVDINPKKQGKYIAGSAHRIVSPDELKMRYEYDIEGIIIMNENYLEEIKRMVKPWTGKFYTVNEYLEEV